MPSPESNPFDPQMEEETNFSPQPLGPSSRGCCKVTVSGVCGSGSLVGYRNGKSLILTNAHVAGTSLGRVVQCQFPFLQNETFSTRIIMAAYSRNAIGMDWAILEADSSIPLPHTKLDNRLPQGDHYTAGYPRCSGPRFQSIRLKSFMSGGTIAVWQPNAIGGQSGSAVHRSDNHLQSILLTWSIGSDGAGQTAYGIWLQYANRSPVGYLKPEGLIELAWEQKRHPPEDLQEGFHYEANITTLDIWAHLNPMPETPPVTECQEFSQEILKKAEQLSRQASDLAEFARRYGAKNNGSSPGMTFGL